MKHSQTLTPTIVHQDLHRHADPAYRAFLLKGLPTVDPANLIGVRMPRLRALAKSYLEDYDCQTYLTTLPHQYFEEQLIHGHIIAQVENPAEVLEHIESYLPHLDNWASCDSFSPRAIKRHPAHFYPHLLAWLESPHEYTSRFALVMLLKHYLNPPIQPELFSTVQQLNRPEYYVRMAQSWFWAEALAKQWDEAVGYIPLLDEWIRRKAIQKARESRKVPEDRKHHLERFL